MINSDYYTVIQFMKSGNSDMNPRRQLVDEWLTFKSVYKTDYGPYRVSLTNTKLTIDYILAKEDSSMNRYIRTITKIYYK